VFLSIGSNVGNRFGNLNLCVGRIRDLIGDVALVSLVYKTSSWGFDSQYFLNQVIEVRTDVEPLELLELTQGLEKEMGRVKQGESYEDRIIDIDILVYADRIVKEPKLIIPHRSISERMFVLMPWADISPDLVIPDMGKTVEELKEECGDKGSCERWEYV